MPKPIDINAYIAEHPGVLTIRDWRGTHPVTRYDYAETKAYVVDDDGTEHWFSLQANDILHAHGLSAEPPRYAMGETVGSRFILADVQLQRCNARRQGPRKSLKSRRATSARRLQ